MVHSDFHSRDFSTFNQRTNRLLEQGRIKKRCYSPTFLFLTHKFGLSDEEIHEAYTEGGNDLGIDAVYIETRTEDPRIHLIQAKCYESESKSRNPYPHSALSRISHFLDVLRNEDAKLDKVANIQLAEKIATIRHLQKHEFPELFVWLVSNGSPAKDHEVDSVRKRLLNEMEVEEFHLNDFVDLMQKRRQSLDKRTFFARDRGLLDITMGEMRCLNGLISATELCDLIKYRTDHETIDPSVFDLNVRGFLGYSSEINKDIYRSATSSRRDRFWILNNGITMVAEEGKVSKNTDQPKIQVKNLSIVNGAQTCSAIFKAVMEFGDKAGYFSDVSIPFRLLFTKNDELIHTVAVTTNSQNRVNPRDLKANDPLQKEIEISLRKVGLGYIRRRGDELYEDGLERLDALKAGQIIMSYQLGRPDRAKSDSDSIFTTSYNTVFNKFDVTKMVRGNLLYNRITEKKDALLGAVLRKPEEDEEAALLKYGSFHVLSLCGILENFFPEMTDKDLIEKSINIISEDLATREKTALYVYFRSPRIARRLLDIPVQPELPLKK